jgi:DNA topoisomerase III
VQQVGWKALEVGTEKNRAADKRTRRGEEPSEEEPSEEEQDLPGGLAPRQKQDVLDAESLKKRTRAPQRFTDGTLLTAMETAGKTLEQA